MDRLKLVRVITGELFSTADLEVRLRLILQLAMQTVGAEGGSILLHDRNTKQLVFRHVVGENSARLTGLSIPDIEGIAGRVFQSNSAQLTTSAVLDPSHSKIVDKLIGHHTTGLLTAPIRSGTDQPIGVLQLVNATGSAFKHEDLELIEIVADISAVAIKAAQFAQNETFAQIGRTVGDLAHDLKNKVFVITGWLDTIEPDLAQLRSAAPEATQMITDVVGYIREAAEDVHRQAKAVADSAKGAAQEMRFVPTRFGDIVTESVRGAMNLARLKGVELIPQITSAREGKMDRALMEQMVGNLLHNAVEATPQGGKVYVSVREADADGIVCFLLEVRDTGCGMPPYKLQEILEGRATTTKASGSGLGTRIIFDAVKAHNGKLEGESELGRGTQFTASLPIS